MLKISLYQVYHFSGKFPVIACFSVSDSSIFRSKEIKPRYFVNGQPSATKKLPLVTLKKDFAGIFGESITKYRKKA